ncbi:MAG: GNAT family N-acetyltransferase [Clostridiales bacterium]|nr:GNAT family N-acetyltransferase [Clostridiales bacterium]
MLKIPEIKGDTVLLRKVREKDIDDRYEIGRHNEFEYMCGGEKLETPQFPSRETWVNWYKNQVNEELLWVIDYQGKCIGTAGFHNVSPEDNSATYKIGIFDPNFHSKGIGTEVTKLLVKFGFDKMKWHRIDLKVLEYNLRGICCYEKCGFKQDGILRESSFVEGRYYSDIVMSILDYEYEELYK